MKRGILFVTLGITVAGVASANVFTSASSYVAPQPQPREAAALTDPASPPELPAKPGSKAKAPVVQKASVEARKPPVPLQTKSRAPVNLPAVEAKATEAKPGDAVNPQEAAASSDGFNEAAAKAAIEADGYKGVRILRKDVNGVWRATGMRGQTVVLLMVDAKGSVSAE